MVNAAYLPHLFYSLAVTSLATHLLWTRTAAEEERRQLGAQVTLLESLSQRLRVGDISSDEVERMRRLAKDPPKADTATSHTGGPIGWREVLLGRRRTGGEGRSEEYDQRDWDKCKSYTLSMLWT